jgi:pyruvate/2-oxoglutarate dehydrogenase complex dihydrolipoamide acyltransferase (E2) component
MGAVSSIGKIMAERTNVSWTQVPQFYVTRAVDATNLNASRRAVCRRSSGRTASR